MAKITLGSANVSNGRATKTVQLDTDNTLAGNKTLYAVFQQDDIFMEGTGTSVAQIRIPTTATLPATHLVSHGETVTFTANIKDYANNNVSDGTATFYLGSNVIASEVSLTNDGVATFQYQIPNDTETGAVLTVNYNGTGIYATAEATSTIQVRGISNVVVPSFSANRGETKNITATITDSEGSNIDEGTATLKVDGVVVGEAVNVEDGEAVFSYTVNNEMTFNGHSILVEYDGGVNYDPSSGSATLTVRVPTTITVADVSVNPGEQVSLVATVTPTSGSMNTSVANRTVNFYVDGGQAQTAVLDTVNGSAQASISYTADSNASGSVEYYAEFVQDDDFIASTSSEGTITFRRGVNVTVDSVYGLIGNNVDLGASVTEADGETPVDEGQVVFELETSP